MLIILSPDTAAESRWRVAHARHAQCPQCEKAARTAATDARAFGSRGGDVPHHPGPCRHRHARGHPDLSPGPGVIYTPPVYSE